MKGEVAVIDNYDSFTYNLVHAVNQILATNVNVYRNDQVSISALDKYDCLILSPGPGIPEEAGLLKDIIRSYASTKKILGVCLGQQAIGEVFGGRLKNLAKVYHGVQSTMIRTDIESKLYDAIPGQFEAGRYHSWVIDKDSLPDNFQITCYDEQGEIMGIQHKEYRLHGVQYHPESVLTPLGERIIENFLFKC